MRPLLISHRGDTSSASENTMEAFTSAFAKGAQGIEFDVQLNDQGEIIIVHHYLYDKFSHYPKLEDVLQQFGQKGLLEIELKGLEIELVEKVAALIGKYQPKQYSLTSNILPLLPIVRQYFPKADIGAIIKPYFIEDWMTPEIIKRIIFGYMKLVQANIVHFYPEYCTKELVDFCHKEGFLAHFHLHSDDINEYKKALDLGVDRCTFDKINLLEKINPLA